MKITAALTDDAVLAELGARIAARRIDLQLTQAAVAEQAGIAKRTLERMEAGKTSELSTLNQPNWRARSHTRSGARTKLGSAAPAVATKTPT